MKKRDEVSKGDPFENAIQFLIKISKDRLNGLWRKN
jgi:hypothetical protein